MFEIPFVLQLLFISAFGEALIWVVDQVRQKTLVWQNWLMGFLGLAFTLLFGLPWFTMLGIALAGYIPVLAHVYIMVFLDVLVGFVIFMRWGGSINDILNFFQKLNPTNQ